MDKATYSNNYIYIYHELSKGWKLNELYGNSEKTKEQEKKYFGDKFGDGRSWWKAKIINYNSREFVIYNANKWKPKHGFNIEKETRYLCLDHYTLLILSKNDKQFNIKCKWDLDIKQQKFY